MIAILLIAAQLGAGVGERWIELTNTHTHEVVKVVYRNAEGYVPEALRQLDHVLRDHRTETNAKLAAVSGGGVSTRSQHVHGRAVDVRLKGYPTADLRDRALELERGGVGYYRRSDFVHVDTGRVRRWTG